MIIYLWHDDTSEWKLYDSEDSNFKKELEDRKIVIGNEAFIGDWASIGDKASITLENIFSPHSILYHLNLITVNNKVTVYKAVTKDLKDFYSEKYQYKIGEGDKCNAKPEQKINCGEGWHFSNLQIALNWLKDKEYKGKIISSEIDIKDILHIGWKLRVRAFDNVRLVDIDCLK